MTEPRQDVLGAELQIELVHSEDGWMVIGKHGGATQALLMLVPDDDLIRLILPTIRPSVSTFFHTDEKGVLTP